MTTKKETVMNIALEKLVPFRDHPFQVRDDEQMQMITESIRSVGVLVPAIARPLEDGSFELISGHRRKHACEVAGLSTLPVIVRDVDQDTATVMMVDSNFQREEILPSERAKAYKMKLEAIKRQGARSDLTSDQVGQKSERKTSRDLIAENSPDSSSQIQRYLRLNELNQDLLKMVDEGKIALTPAAELSFLSKEEQDLLLLTIESEQSGTPVLSGLSAKGGVPQKGKEALNDEQVELLLDSIKGLPPYVFVMLGLYAGLRREEILALQWDCVHLDVDAPYLSVRRAWHTEHNRPVILTELKTKAARRDVPLPKCLVECLKEAKEESSSEYVIANSEGEPLSYTQFKRVWQYIVTRSTKERTYVRYVNGEKIKHTVTPVLGEVAPHNGKVTYSMDFQVTPHQLRHTYITNLIYAQVDPKTVQYLAGHENSKITMDIYAKVKYNKPKELAAVVNGAFGQ